MCGIIGYNGKRNAKEVILRGLHNLEYRGYDSAGLALGEEDHVSIYKSKGNIATLEKKVKNFFKVTHCGIGHTRWATHGEPNETNAHPHQQGKVTLVHNGIIENYDLLKRALEKQGVSFYSSTDSEVAAATFNYYYQKDPDHMMASVIKTCAHFTGSYAFGIMFEEDSNAIYATRKDSPLVLGIGEGENFIASDISAFLPYTKQYIILEEGEFARITPEAIEIVDRHLQPIQKKILTAQMEARGFLKNGYAHFMLKEIHEQPQAIQDVFDRYEQKSDPIYETIDFANISDIRIVACGSALHAGMVGKHFFENYAQIPTSVEIASEYRYRKQLLSPTTLVIIVSQSGETADTLAALRISKQQGIKTLGIVNVESSTIARESDVTLYTNAGPEVAVATTKGYTTQVASFITLTLQAMKQKNLPLEKEELFLQEYHTIGTDLQAMLEDMTPYQTIAKQIYEHHDLFYLGREIDYYLGLEGSLKLKEISYIHSECYAAGELKHGTISLIEPNTPVIAIATDDVIFEKTMSNIIEVKSRGAFVVGIMKETFGKHISSNNVDSLLLISNHHPLLQPFFVSIVLQLIAYETAKLRGCHIDKPKNLAKSVTVE